MSLLVLSHLSDLYRKESRYAEATENDSNRFAEIREATLTKEHPDYGKSAVELGFGLQRRRSVC